MEFAEETFSFYIFIALYEILRIRNLVIFFIVSVFYVKLVIFCITL